MFRRYLALHRPLSPETAAALYELGEQDPDPALGAAMKHEVVELPECPDVVLDQAAAPGSDTWCDWLQRGEAQGHRRTQMGRVPLASR